MFGRLLTDDIKISMTGFALIVSILMLLGLLWIVASNGLIVFWPKSIALLSLASETDDGKQQENTLLVEFSGALIKHASALQEEKNETISTKKLNDETNKIKIYTGGRDVFGLAYRYLPEKKILGYTIPADVLQIERMEYGPLLAFPLSLKRGEGTETGQLEIQVFNQSFFRELDREMKDATRIRKQIRFLERKKLSGLMRQIEVCQIRVRKMDEKASKNGQKDKGKRKDLEEKVKWLRDRFVACEDEVLSLRAELQNSTLTVSIPKEGELLQKELSFEEILDYSRPNTMSFIKRIWVYCCSFWEFLSTDPREANTEGGIFPAIFGTFIMTIFMSIVVLPFGVLGAIYLREYAKEGLLLRIVRISVNNLAGVPSIVFGIFGLGFFVYFTGHYVDVLFFSDQLPTPTFGTGGVLWASFTLALLTVPVVIVSTEEGLASVSRGVREGALACGATKWQMVKNILLPAAAPGMLTGLILAVARGAGEVAPLMLVGVVKLAPALPIDGQFPFFHLERKFMHLGFHIYDLGFQSPDSEAALPMVFTTTLLLILLVVMVNLVAVMMRHHLRKKYQLSSV